MNHNWHIGQDIVCIKTHSKGYSKEGNVYTVKSLRKRCCHVQIDIGEKVPDRTGSGKWTTTCSGCKSEIDNGTDNTAWLSERLFAPLDTLTDITEIEEILKQPIETLYQI